MASSSKNSSSGSSMRRDALNRYKTEAASEVGVNLKQGYNGDLTSREAGSIGGQIVKKVFQSHGPVDGYKMEAASEVGVNLKQGYNGDLTSREAGSVGGQIVKKVFDSLGQ
jgi:small acid-soluble spore protein D (minor alpha/beta-type SASP)